jgi:hypothetical protein
MASCPPGKVLNPYTLKCVRVTGRKGRKLLEEGAIGEVDVLRQVAFDQPRRRTARVARIVAPEAPCPPGTVRNPTTRRCINESGRVFKRLFPAPPPPVALPPVPPPPAVAAALQKPASDQPLRLPIGVAGVAPLSDKATILDWASANCTNSRDPITGIPFSSADTATLQELIRLHNRTCALANPLNAKVAAEHKVGKIAAMPGDVSTSMTLDDFRALRNAMRRRNPDYKLPARKHMPPPPSWKLYIASDNRSGPEYATVLYVDVTRARKVPQGVIYPLDAVMVDMGFLPLNMDGTELTPQTFVTLFKQLDNANRLLLAVPGGWKPVVAPPTKKYWETEKARKLTKYYAELQAALVAAV